MKGVQGLLLHATLHGAKGSMKPPGLPRMERRDPGNLHSESALHRAKGDGPLVDRCTGTVDEAHGGPPYTGGYA